MKKKWTLPAIYALAVLILAIIIYAVPSLMGLLDVTYIAEYGDVKVEDTVADAWIVRDDTVYCADKDAKIDVVVQAGTLVKGKARVLNLEDGGSGRLSTKFANLKTKLGDDMKNTEGLAGRSGYVSYTADGYEATLRSATMEALTEKELKKITTKNVKLTANSCHKGQALFRITKNGAWWLVFFTDKEGAEKYTEGRSVQTTIDDVTLNTKVRSVTEAEDDRYKVILTCKEYDAIYLSERRVSISNVTENDNGLLLKVDSIVEVDDQQGVLVKDKLGKFHFTPIKIIASDGEDATVYEDLYMNDQSEFVETISSYDEILKSPSKNDIKKAKENM